MHNMLYYADHAKYSIQYAEYAKCINLARSAEYANKYDRKYEKNSDRASPLYTAHQVNLVRHKTCFKCSCHQLSSNANSDGIPPSFFVNGF